MRLLLLGILLCAGAAAQQQPPSLVKYLGLTTAQTAAIQQLNNTFNQFFQAKQQRSNTVNSELGAEYAKPSPDPLALGQRYVELDSINQEIASQQSAVQAKVAALLTPAQIASLNQISAAIVQASLVQDAGCAYLGNASPITNFVSTTVFADFLLGAPKINLNGAIGLASFTSAFPGCGSSFPISIRNYLAVTETEVSGILAIQAAYQAFYVQKQNRIADVQVEIRDETAKPSPDPLALGVRYAELLEISQELKQADQQDRAAARALLTASQQTLLRALLAAADLNQYIFEAESCNLISPPLTDLSTFSFTLGYSCSLN